jgi:hypothetical protein
MRETAQTGDAQVTGSKRTPLLDDLVRSINAATFSNLGNGASDAVGIRPRDGGSMMKEDRKK